ncbi:putative sulfite oxidase, mitochondrial [Portunus trituberculatus]|uniref:Putative sulfite oxidase, mitochondrial n=1 Tax=Portunus trituberculatus TaxID=210409 RepID=A0A5B7IA97_PORTR|nr:putative sulfite oxidase, mitochondrial [Portunus trituberculatus]
MDDPYGNEPRRHAALKPSSKKPFNAEPPLRLLVDSLVTPKQSVGSVLQVRVVACISSRKTLEVGAALESEQH